MTNRLHEDDKTITPGAQQTKDDILPDRPSDMVNEPDNLADPIPFCTQRDSTRPCPQSTVQKQPLLNLRPTEQKADCGTETHEDNEQKVSRPSRHLTQPPTANHSPLAKTTRSGATYLAETAQPPHHIRAPPADQCTHRHISTRRVTFNKQVEVNFEGKISLVPLTSNKQITNSYFLVAIAFDMDFSPQELLYTANNSQPLHSAKIKCQTDENLD